MSSNVGSHTIGRPALDLLVIETTTRHVLFRGWDRIVCIVGRGGDGDRAQRERMCRPNLGQVCVVGERSASHHTHSVQRGMHSD